MRNAAAPTEKRIREIGREIFDRARAAEPRPWKRAWWDDLATSISMKDENLKVRLFRFVDVLPSLRTEEQIVDHLRQYVDPAECDVPGPLRLAMQLGRPGSAAGNTLAWAIRRGAHSMAARFITGSNAAEAIASVLRMRKQKMAFTLDLLGESTICRSRADAVAQTYLELIESLGPAAKYWPEVARIDRSSSGSQPRVNVSVKLTALVPHFDPVNPERTYAQVAERLRPILRAAQKHKAFINVDMEHFGVRDLTLQLFKRLMTEPEFCDFPDVGIVVQAYLKDGEADYDSLLQWVRQRGCPIAVRLVKGAYWDHETILAAQFHTPIPVWTRKWESDACYERITRKMLDHYREIRPAFASHNVRSLAAVIAGAEHLAIPPGDFEIQMLNGMGDPLKTAMVKMGQFLRVYAPYGDLLPGMAYLIRRLLENTSNDSFLRQGFTERRSLERLLADPAVAQPPSTPPAMPRFQDTDVIPDWSGQEQGMSTFQNVAAVSFARAENRSRMTQALEKARSEFNQHHPLIIDGVGITTDETITSLNPSHPVEIVGRTSSATPNLADKAVASANKAFANWRRTSPADRARLLRKAADLIEEQRLDLAAWIVLEAGKPWSEADADVCEGLDYMRYYAGRIELMHQRPRRRDLPGENNVLLYEPRGVCVVIGPFNFPLALLAGMASAALAAGNTVILKPSSHVPVVAARFATILDQAGFPRGVVNYLPGAGHSAGDHLVRHRDVHLVAFTGSTDVGLNLVETASIVRPGQRHLKHVIAEMGGKNATIVDADAEISDAVVGVRASAFGYAGQRCSACSRAIVLADVYEDFCRLMTEATAELVVGPADAPETQVGPVISRAAADRIAETVAAVRKQGQVLLQMDTSNIPGEGYFVGPTIIGVLDASGDELPAVARQEIFGPVLSIIRAQTFEQALQIANDSPYALTGGLYSRSPAHLELARQEFRAGNLYLNRKITGSRVDVQPFGGFGLSGTACGKAGGPDYLLQFCHARNITENALRHGFAPAEHAEPAHQRYG